MMSTGIGGSLVAMIWLSDWVWLLKREFLNVSTFSSVILKRERLLSSHLSGSSLSTRVSVNGASSPFLLTQR